MKAASEAKVTKPKPRDLWFSLFITTYTITLHPISYMTLSDLTTLLKIVIQSIIITTERQTYKLLSTFNSYPKR